MTIIPECAERSNAHTPPLVEKSEIPVLLTIAEVARILRWDEMTVRRHIRSSVIPTWAIVRLPHHGKRARYRIKRTWLDQMLAGNNTNNVAKPPL
jgi:hypothetical protein